MEKYTVTHETYTTLAPRVPVVHLCPLKSYSSSLQAIGAILEHLGAEPEDMPEVSHAVTFTPGKTTDNAFLPCLDFVLRVRTPATDHSDRLTLPFHLHRVCVGEADWFFIYRIGTSGTWYVAYMDEEATTDVMDGVSFHALFSSIYRR